MYKLSFIILGLAYVVVTAPVDQTSPVAIVKQSQDGPNPDGSYSWSFDTENGIKAQETGTLISSQNDKDGAISAQGSYSYPAQDGASIEVTYTADENGYQPQGSHLPTPPPIPHGIMKALEYIAAHPEENNIDTPKQ